MEEPFVRDRQVLYELVQRRRTGEFEWVRDSEAWDSAYHNPLRVALTVDADSALTWYEAK